MTSYKDKYDLSLFGKKPDNQIAKQYGISRERIRQIRVREGIPTYKPKSKQKLNNQKLLKYLKKNKNNVKITDIRNLGIIYLNRTLINKKFLIKYAKLNKINIIFAANRKYKHGYTNSQYGCKCKICKLAKAIYQVFRVKIINGISYHISPIQSSYYANKYILKYKNDKSRKKTKFYGYLIKIIKKELKL